MRVLNSVTAALAVAALGGSVINLSTRNASAAPRAARQAEAPGFGLVTVAPGQNLRLNVVNTATADPQLPPDPCRVQVVFVDARGDEIGDTQFADLEAGESLSTEAFGNGRRQTFARLRPVVRVGAGRRRQLPPNPCVPTLEVFDVASGKTTLLLDGAGRTQSLSTTVSVPEIPSDRQ